MLPLFTYRLLASLMYYIYLYIVKKLLSLTPELLTRPVVDLPISDRLRRFFEIMDFDNLKDLLAAYSGSQLLSLNGFDYHCLTEVYWMLEEGGCEEMLRE
ncbi:hypothetical protein SAMN04488029_3404 [Reichenbachiella faecimaris]|uniref:Uncharacterized protein n=1 Tax=Reichenbachiella faecimaris TaxID=692418 RepID=A0A1W2GMK2_REIFA|nr:hypothetical protein SAMN04488029_3404 [Reichenbachiella faecimaris]